MHRAILSAASPVPALSFMNLLAGSDSSLPADLVGGPGSTQFTAIPGFNCYAVVFGYATAPVACDSRISPVRRAGPARTGHGVALAAALGEETSPPGAAALNSVAMPAAEEHYMVIDQHRSPGRTSKPTMSEPSLLQESSQAPSATYAAAAAAGIAAGRASDRPCEGRQRCVTSADVPLAIAFVVPTPLLALAFVAAIPKASVAVPAAVAAGAACAGHVDIFERA